MRVLILIIRVCCPWPKTHVIIWTIWRSYLSLKSTVLLTGWVQPTHHALLVGSGPSKNTQTFILLDLSLRFFNGKMKRLYNLFIAYHYINFFKVSILPLWFEKMIVLFNGTKEKLMWIWTKANIGINMDAWFSRGPK